MIYGIPTSNKESVYTQRTILDGVEYELQFRFNTRESNWYVDLLDTDGNYLAAGRKVVVDSVLWKGETSDSMFPGFLYAIDSTLRGNEAGLRDLRDRVWLMYVDDDSAVD